MPSKSEKEKIITALCQTYSSDIIMVETSKHLIIVFNIFNTKKIIYI